MRVISGTARGRRLKEPKGDDVRPTGERVKEAIFNIIQFEVRGRALDLFAGTGQLGVEALSRGAASAVFVDSSKAAVELVAGNVKLCGFCERASVHCRDAISYLRSCEAFDLIFIDPPYGSTLAAEALRRIFEFDKIDLGGIIVCETGADTGPLPAPPPGFSVREYRYGSVRITLFRRNIQR